MSFWDSHRPKRRAPRRQNAFPQRLIIIPRQLRFCKPFSRNFCNHCHEKSTQPSAKSGKRDSNPRPSPWQGDALPLSHFRISFWDSHCLKRRAPRRQNVFPQRLIRIPRCDGFCKPFLTIYTENHRFFSFAVEFRTFFVKSGGL